MELFIITADIDQFYTVISIDFNIYRSSFSSLIFINMTTAHIIKEFYNMVQLVYIFINYNSNLSVEKWHLYRNLRKLKRVVCLSREAEFLKKYVMLHNLEIIS